MSSLRKLKMENEVLKSDIRRIKLKIAEKILEKYL